jgi:hypothetical protein
MPSLKVLVSSGTPVMSQRPSLCPHPILEKKDEITDLADDINRMLGKIEETEFTLHHQQHLFERLLLYTPAVILVVDGQENITWRIKLSVRFSILAK